VKTKILCVDDNSRLLRLLRANLVAEGYSVLTAGGGSSALELFRREDPDLVVLDVMLPGELDGLQVLECIRSYSTVPVLILSAKGRDIDKVEGLNRGADDYLAKPFSSEELLARVNALLRRTQLREVETPCYEHKGQRRVWLQGREIELTATEYNLLAALARNRGRIMLHDQLLEEVWGPEYAGEVEYLRTYVARLRKKLGDEASQPRYIFSRPGAGYYIP